MTHDLLLVLVDGVFVLGEGALLEGTSPLAGVAHEGRLL